MNPPQLQILLLCNYQSTIPQTLRDHMDALRNFSRHRVHRLSLSGPLPRVLELERFDVVIVHYTLLACDEPEYLLPTSARRAIAAFRGLKVAFMHDEYCHVNATMERFREMGIHLLFSCAPPTSLDLVYPPERLPGVRKVSIQCGYIPRELLERPVPPFRERPVDVGYRGRPLPPWLGEGAQEKSWIGERFARDCAAHGLVCDLSAQMSQRVYGEGWIDFLLNCKAVLAVAGGASVIDFTGEVERAVREHLRHHPHTPFAELQRLYFRDQENRIPYRLLSPRHFEAAALRTLMILYEEDYGEILVPWRHYLPLRKDHGNAAQVAATLRDEERCREIIDHAYREVALRPDLALSHLGELLDREVDRAFQPAIMAARRPPGWNLTLALWESRLRLIPYRLKEWLPQEWRSRLRRLKARLLGRPLPE